MEHFVDGHHNITVGKIKATNANIAIGHGAKVIINHIERTKAEMRESDRQIQNERIGNWVTEYIYRIAKGNSNDNSDIPYRYLVPYGLNDAALFFGREQDTRKLLSLVNNDTLGRLVVLQSDSGAGKTSLLQAGLAATLLDDESGHLPVYVSFGRVQPDIALKRTLIPELKVNDDDEIIDLPLDRFLIEVTKWLKDNAKLVIIFDQFEDFFILGQNESNWEKFFQQLYKCIQTDSLVNVRFVISLRTDKFGYFSKYDEQRHYYSMFLNPLTLKEAKDAIIKPAEKYNLHYEEGLVDEIIKQLQAVRITETNSDEQDNTQEISETILPTHLQLVCWALYEQFLSEPLEQDKPFIVTRQQFKDLGEVKDILRLYFQRTLNKFGNKDEKNQVLELLKFLITPEKYRDRKSEEQIGNGFSHLSNLQRILHQLKQYRLVIEKDGNYELVHDYLITFIDLTPEEQSFRDIQEFWFDAVRRYNLDRTKLLQDRDFEQIKTFKDKLNFRKPIEHKLYNDSETNIYRKKWGYRIVAIVFGVILGVIVYAAIYSRNEANNSKAIATEAINQKQIVEAQITVAVATKQAVEVQITVAVATKQAVDIEAAEAKVAKQTAEAAKQKADAQASVAVIAKQTANAQVTVAVVAKQNAEKQVTLAIDAQHVAQTQATVAVELKQTAEAQTTSAVVAQATATFAKGQAEIKATQAFLAQQAAEKLQATAEAAAIVAEQAARLAEEKRRAAELAQQQAEAALTQARDNLTQAEMALASVQALQDATQLSLENSIKLEAIIKNKTECSLWEGRRPTDLVYDGKNIWVLNQISTITVSSQPAVLMQINATNCDLVSRNFEVGDSPKSMVYDAELGYIWIAGFDNILYQINAATNQTITQICLISDEQNQCANNRDAKTLDITLGEGYLWVTIATTFGGKFKGQITKIDRTDLSSKNMEVYNIPEKPNRIIYNDKYLWVTHNTGILSKIDISSRQVLTLSAMVSPTDFIPTPTDLIYHEGYIWLINNGNKLVKISATTPIPIVIEELQLGFAVIPHSLAFDANGNLWVANHGADNLIEIFAPKLANLSQVDIRDLPKVPIAGNPLGSLFDGTYLWVISESSEVIYRIPVTIYPTGHEPMALAWYAQYLWVANRGSNTISKVAIENSQRVQSFSVLQPTILHSHPNGLWVASPTSKTITRFTLNSDTMISTTFDIDIYPDKIVYDGYYLWAISSLSNTVVYFHERDKPNLINFTLPSDIIVDNQDIWVASEKQKLLAHFKADMANQLEVVTYSLNFSSTLSFAPKSILKTQNGVWIGYNNSNSSIGLAKFQLTNDNKIVFIKKIAISELYNFPRLAFSDGDIWVASSAIDKVAKLDMSVTNSPQITYYPTCYPSDLLYTVHSIWVSCELDDVIQKVTTINSFSRKKALNLKTSYLPIIIKNIP